MKNSFFAIALGLFILSCNYEKSSNGNIDQAFAHEDYPSVYGQQKKEIREKQMAASQNIKSEPQAVEVIDTTTTVTPTINDSTQQVEEAHH